MTSAQLQQTASRLQRELATGGHDALQQLADRAVTVRDELREDLGHRVEELEPVARRARAGGWRAVSTILDVVLAVPRLVVRLLGAVADTVDELAGRGEHLREQARDVAAAVPLPRDRDQRRRVALVAWVGAGFSAGVLTGWLLARRCARREADLAEEWTAPPALPAVDEQGIAAVSGVGSEAEPSEAASVASGPAGAAGSAEAREAEDRDAQARGPGSDG